MRLALWFLLSLAISGCGRSPDINNPRCNPDFMNSEITGVLSDDNGIYYVTDHRLTFLAHHNLDDNPETLIQFNRSAYPKIRLSNDLFSLRDGEFIAATGEYFKSGKLVADLTSGDEELFFSHGNKRSLLIVRKSNEIEATKDGVAYTKVAEVVDDPVYGKPYYTSLLYSEEEALYVYEYVSEMGFGLKKWTGTDFQLLHLNESSYGKLFEYKDKIVVVNIHGFWIMDKASQNLVYEYDSSSYIYDAALVGNQLITSTSDDNNALNLDTFETTTLNLGMEGRILTSFYSDGDIDYLGTQTGLWKRHGVELTQLVDSSDKVACVKM
ncbi:hypothetical protein KUV89_08205 [Marinobacter hydrocarbonoclasticus]|nr:hypothetical protein [Marinobacter nauticus]